MRSCAFRSACYRRWSHVNASTSLGYTTEGRIPLSVENGEPMLCQCGNCMIPGQFVASVPPLGWHGPLASEAYDRDVDGLAMRHCRLLLRLQKWHF